MLQGSRSVAMLVLMFTWVLLIGGCEPSTPASKATLVKLEPADLSETARLTGSEVDGFVGACVARRKTIHSNLAGNAEYIRKIGSTIDATFPNFCACLASNFERRMTKMQFLMAQEMVESGSIISFPGSAMPVFEGIRAGAAVHGMSAAEFEKERQKFRRHASTSAENCFLCLSAPPGQKCWQ